MVNTSEHFNAASGLKKAGLGALQAAGGAVMVPLGVTATVFGLGFVLWLGTDLCEVGCEMIGEGFKFLGRGFNKIADGSYETFKAIGHGNPPPAAKPRLEPHF
jgi:hypothetical protein